MNKPDAIRRACEFLKNLEHIDIGLYEDEEIHDSYNFSDSNKPYFVYMDHEIYGCFSSETYFMTKIEVNELIADQFSGEEKWDHVVILDIENNKTITPHI